jgi:hypothetical protein
MSGNVNPHNPIVAGGVTAIGTTGTVTVRTGLRDLQSWSVMHTVAPVADTAYIYANKRIVGGEAFLDITVLDNGFGACSTATSVVWIALGV